jgi:1,4-dihydroxy-2-naphthoyl-CoA hydrolase
MQTVNDSATSQPARPETSVELTEMVAGLMPFTGLIGLEILSNTAQECVGIADWEAERCTVGGVLHGGFLMSLADSLGAVCAMANLPPGAVGTSTIESKTNFLRAATAGPVTITSTPLHAGRTTIVVQTDIHRPDGKLVTRTIQTQAVLS